MLHYYEHSARITAISLGLWAAVIFSSAGVSWLFLRVQAVRKVVSETEAGRVRNLDGLRGILALSVMVDHSFLMQGYFLYKNWEPPKNTFDEVLGRGAVTIFFMITAFLFWSRAIASSGKLDPQRLYVSRFRRITPAFVASITAAVIIVLTLTHFRLHVPPGAFAISLLRHLSFGLWILTPINGFKMAYVLDNVTWSLAYEMAFISRCRYFRCSCGHVSRGSPRCWSSSWRI